MSYRKSQSQNRPAMYTETNLLKGAKKRMTNLGRFGTNMHNVKTYAQNSIYNKTR